MGRVREIVLSLVAVAGLSLPAGAQDMKSCTSGPGDQRLLACNRIIDAQKKPEADALVRALVGRCEARRMTRDYDGAVADCSEALKIDAKNAEAFYQRGLAHRFRNDPDHALPDLNQAIEYGAGDRLADYYYNRLVAYEFRNDWDACLANAEAALKIRPREKTFLNSRGWCYGQKRDYAAAVKDYDEVISIDPQYFNVWYNRGRMNRYRNELGAALADLDTALQIAPNSSVALLERAFVYERQKDWAKAVADIDAAATRAPGDNNIKIARERIHAAAEGKAPPPVLASPIGTAQAAPRTQKADNVDLTAALANSEGKRRVALVIGNSAYKFASPLPNPANDSTDIAATLRKLDFTVVEGHDLDWRGMVQLVKEFAARLDKADLAMVFYAGHGVQVNGENYLVPIDAKLETAGALDLDALDLRAILRPMEDRKRVNLVFLDACRDNPFTRSISRASPGASRSVAVSQGLAQVQAAAGTMVVYATQPDNVALDGKGRNSPFTAALLKYLPRVGLEVEQMMKSVRVDVMNATQQRQVPWNHSSLVGDVYIAPAKE